MDNEVPTVFYGATGFVTSIARNGTWSPGVFFEEAQFEFSRCLDKLGQRLVNADAQLTTLRDLRQDPRPDDTELFLRPTGDTKEFAGNVFTLAEVKSWLDGLDGEDMVLSLDCPVVVAEPVGLAYEWRVFMVAGQAAGGSQYRRYHQLRVKGGLPQEVVTFAQDTACLYSPAEVFVMDLARSGDALYVVEYNCFNSSGFYGTNIRSVVEAIGNAF